MQCSILSGGGGQWRNGIQYAWSQVIRGDYFEATVYMGYMLTHRDKYMKRQLLPYHDPSADVLDNMYKK